MAKATLLIEMKMLEESNKGFIFNSGIKNGWN